MPQRKLNISDISVCILNILLETVALSHFNNNKISNVIYTW